VVGLAFGTVHGQTVDGHLLASPGIPAVLDLEKRRVRPGGPEVSQEVEDLIRKMSAAKPLWGSPRIHGQMLKLGIEVSQATVAKYIIRQRKPPSQTWCTFSTIT
jgi:hypothetical protein